MLKRMSRTTEIFYLLGFLPMLVIKISERVDINNVVHIHKMYWLFGFVPLFSTDSGLKNTQI